jgi:hypothetical protein
MFKKIIIGMLAVAVLCGIARSGYEFGQYLAKQEKAGHAASSGKLAAKN